MSTTPSAEAPAVARQRVRLVILAARKAKDLTQTEVADAMGWSLSKVMRIEKGEVNIAQSDLRLLLAFLGIEDEVRVQQLLADARQARQERWTVDTRDRHLLTPGMIKIFQFETEATTVRHFQNFVLPGILQTRAYAEAIFALIRPKPDPEVVAARVKSRLRRREEILLRDSPPNYLVALDESVLRRPVGGLDVMADQLDDLAQLVDETRTLTVRILPLGVPVVVLPFYGPFTLYSLADDQDALLYREGPFKDETVRAPAVISQHRKWFEDVWAAALDERDSVRLIRDQATALRAV